MQLDQIPIGVRPSLSKPRRRGDFDIYINTDRHVMMMPSNLYNFIILESNAKNARSAIKYLHDYLPRVARFLKWTEKEAEDALQKLLAHVNGVLNMPQPKTGGKK